MTFSTALRPPHQARFTFSGDSLHDDFIDVPDVDAHLPASAFDPSSPTAVQPPRLRRPRLRFVLTLVGSGLAGVLAGIDIIGIALLEIVLRGTDADFVHVPGVAYAGWSFEAGFGYGFGPGALAILAATAALGVALGWVTARRRAGTRA